MDDFVYIDPIVPAEAAAKPSVERPITPLSNAKKEDADPFVTSLDAHPFVRQMISDRIYGCIVGSALGDTIGLYTEFLSKVQSAKVYSDRKFSLVEPVTELHPDQHRTRFTSCAWTDDTDQALLIILGWLHASTCNPANLSFDKFAQDFASRLKIWISQGLLALDRYPCGIGALVGGTVNSKDYLDDPVGAATRRWVNSGRFQAPNGSLMRAHPIGVIGISMSEEDTLKLSVAVGRTTHVDPRCVVSCCIEVALIRGLLRGDIQDEKDLDACIERCYEWVKSQPELVNPGLDQELTIYEIERHIERREFDSYVYAKTLDELKLDEPSKIGYVYKCLGSAILLLRLAMRATTDGTNILKPLAADSLFEKLMVDLILEGGDADTNGAAAGAVLGAYLGYARLPSHWTLGLAHKEWLIEKTKRISIATGVIHGSLEDIRDEAPEGGVGLRSDKELEHRWALLMADISKRTNAAKEKEAKERIMRQRKERKGFAALFSC